MKHFPPTLRAHLEFDKYSCLRPEKFRVSKLSAQNHLFEIRDAWVYRIDAKELVNHTVAVYLSKETDMGSKSKTRLSLIPTPNLKSL